MRLLLLISLMAISPMLNAATEADYVAAWCTGEVEHVLPDRTRVDCLTDEYAIEVDYARKWAEAIGQALYYASQTGKYPGIMVIVGPKEWRHLERLHQAIDYSGRNIRVWYVDR